MLKLDLHTVAAAILGSIASACALTSGHFFYQELGSVNRKLPDDRQISYLWWYSDKYARVRSEYKRLYPDGNLHRLHVGFEIAAFVFLVLASFASGFFKHWWAAGFK